jgi:hypothetical protein
MTMKLLVDPYSISHRYSESLPYACRECQVYMHPECAIRNNLVCPDCKLHTQMLQISQVLRTKDRELKRTKQIRLALTEGFLRSETHDCAPRFTLVME